MLKQIAILFTAVQMGCFSFCQPSQSYSGPEIVTDRPTITPSALVVPPNYFQAENGLLLRKDNGGGTFNVPQTLLRLGVLRHTELRFTVPNYFLIRNNFDNVSGVTDISVGMKQNCPLPLGVQLAVIPGFTIPTGSRGLTTKRVDPFVQIVASRTFFKNWMLSSAQSIFLQTEEAEVQAAATLNTGNEKQVIYQPTAVISRKLGTKADAILEYAGNFTRGELSDQIIDGALLYRFKRNQQLGLRFGFGLTRISPIAFIEFGYSFRLGKIFGH